MKIITNITQDVIKGAAKSLKNGNLVAFPTETVYGLGADATNENAVYKIYSIKRRPTNHPLIVHISSIDQLEKWAREIPEYAIDLAREFWPGPMTLILKRSSQAKDFITGGQDSVGLRIPDQPLALSLLSEFENIGGIGIAAPSANRFGAVSPTYAQAVYEELGTNLAATDQILDGGECRIGIESTIIDCTNNEPTILRSGSITKNHLAKKLNLTAKIIGENQVQFSGNFKSHYSPKAKIMINKFPIKGEGLIALSTFATPEGVVRLCKPNDSDEFANQLYKALRKADNLGITVISIFLPDRAGLGESIIDRINKAAYRTNTIA